jgi:hypothetical protein
MSRNPTTTELLTLIAPKTNINATVTEKDIAAFTINTKTGLESYQIRVPNLSANKLSRIAHKANELNFRTKNRVVYSEFSDIIIAPPHKLVDDADKIKLSKSVSAPNICLDHNSHVRTSFDDLDLTEDSLKKIEFRRVTMIETKMPILNAPKPISRKVSKQSLIEKNSFICQPIVTSARSSYANTNIKKKKKDSIKTKPKESSVINPYGFIYASIPRLVEEQVEVIAEG